MTTKFISILICIFICDVCAQMKVQPAPSKSSSVATHLSLNPISEQSTAIGLPRVKSLSSLAGMASSSLSEPMIMNNKAAQNSQSSARVLFTMSGRNSPTSIRSHSQQQPPPPPPPHNVQGENVDFASLSGRAPPLYLRQVSI